MTTEMPPTGPEPAGTEPAAAPPAEVPPPAVPPPAEVPAPVAAATTVATTEPSPPASAEPAAAPAPTRRKRDRAVGTAGQVVGIAGLVVCLLLALGVVFARGYAVSAVDDVAATVDAQIAKTDPLLDRAQTTVGEISGKVSTVADIAAGIAANPSPGGEFAQALRDGLAGVNERYQGLREGYAGVREVVLSLIDKLDALDRLIPGISVPQGPIEALNTFDTRVQEFDTKVNDLLTIEPGQGPVNQAAAKIAAAATAIDAKLTALEEGITKVDDRIAQLRTDIANTAGTVITIINLVTVLLVLLLVWIALLHWVLFRHSGEIRKKSSAG
jgi:hypothetical protein